LLHEISIKFNREILHELCKKERELLSNVLSSDKNYKSTIKSN